MEHPSQDALLRFVLGAASRQENRRVVRHLLARCPSCAAALRQLRREPPLSPPPDLEGYDPAFDRLAVLLQPAGTDERAEVAPLPSSDTSANVARQRWLFG